jgi:hypothetical protein
MKRVSHARILLVPILVISCLVGTLSAQVTESQNRRWDISIWAAGATGEENTNSFSEAQIFSAGIFVGKVLTYEIGSSWRRGRLEYTADVLQYLCSLPHTEFTALRSIP